MSNNNDILNNSRTSGINLPPHWSTVPSIQVLVKPQDVNQNEIITSPNIHMAGHQGGDTDSEICPRKLEVEEGDGKEEKVKETANETTEATSPETRDRKRSSTPTTKIVHNSEMFSSRGVTCPTTGRLQSKTPNSTPLLAEQIVFIKPPPKSSSTQPISKRMSPILETVVSTRDYGVNVKCSHISTNDRSSCMCTASKVPNKSEPRNESKIGATKIPFQSNSVIKTDDSSSSMQTVRRTHKGDYFELYMERCRLGKCIAKELLQVCRDEPDLMIEVFRNRNSPVCNVPSDDFVSQIQKTHGKSFGDPKYHYLMVDKTTSMTRPSRSESKLVVGVSEVRDIPEVQKVPDVHENHEEDHDVHEDHDEDHDVHEDDHEDHDVDEDPVSVQEVPSIPTTRHRKRSSALIRKHAEGDKTPEVMSMSSEELIPTKPQKYESQDVSNMNEVRLSAVSFSTEVTEMAAGHVSNPQLLSQQTRPRSILENMLSEHAYQKQLENVHSEHVHSEHTDLSQYDKEEEDDDEDDEDDEGAKRPKRCWWLFMGKRKKKGEKRKKDDTDEEEKKDKKKKKRKRDKTTADSENEEEDDAEKGGDDADWKKWVDMPIIH